MLIMRFTVFMVLFVLVVNISFHRPVLESLMFAVALAVGLTPELLPMIVTVTLARSAMQMAKRKVIVKRLSAIHDLGAMDVLCTDKTGTLTEATIKLVRAIDGTGAESAPAFAYAFINSQFESGMKSPLDAAILGAHPFDMTGWKKIDEVPFDFERRRVSVLVEHDAKRRLIVKGAPEDLLRLSERYEAADGAERPLDAATRRTFEATLDGLGAQGFRALGIASAAGRRDARDRRDHRRERPGVRRLRGFPRSAESQRRRDDPGDGGGGRLGEGADRRQRTRDPPRLRGDRRAGDGRADGRRTGHISRTRRCSGSCPGSTCSAGSIRSRSIGSCWR